MIVAALVLALEPASLPAGIPPRETSIGFGTCEDWTRARYYADGTARWMMEGTVPRWRDERARRMEQWAWGYLTAFEHYRRRSRNVRAQADLRNAFWGRLDDYCAAHQESLFGDAVQTIVERLSRRSSRHR